MTEVADKATARADRNSRDHELLDAYASAQEQPDFLQHKRRRTSAITVLGNDQQQAKGARFAADQPVPVSTGALEAKAELRVPRDGSLSLEQAVM